MTLAPMSSNPTPWTDPEGPFRADHITEGSPFELSNDHAIHCMTAGVRLVGPLRVEVHEPGVPVRLVGADGVLSAPGILARDVPVRALTEPSSSSSSSSPPAAGPSRPRSRPGSPPVRTSRS